MPELTITIKVDYPEGGSVEVLTVTPQPPSNSDTDVPAEVLTRVRRLGGVHAQHELAFLERIAGDLGARVEPAASKRVERINIYAPDGHLRRARIAGLNARSGRLAFPTLPASIADEFELVNVSYNRHRDGTRTADGVAVRLHSSEGVEVAMHLTSLTLEQV
jgi:hypothetical protein